MSHLKVIIMSLKFTKAEQGNILSNDGQTLICEGIVAQVGVVDGIYISPEALKSSARWLSGRAIKIDGRKVGQIDEVSLQGSTKLSVKGQLMGGKLSQAEIWSLKAGEQNFTIKGAFFPITKPQDGSMGGEAFKETAVSLEWDSVILEIPGLKNHAAGTRMDELERLNRSMDSALGKR